MTLLLPTRQSLADAWIATMRAYSVDGHFKLLPSEAAALVAKAFGVEPVDVLLSLAPELRFSDGEARRRGVSTPSVA